MRYCNERSFQSQFEFLKRQFLQDGGLPLTGILSRETLQQAVDTIEFAWNERIYSPLVTLWVFLGQVLSADHSCRGPVARLVVHRVSQGLGACSSKTGAYRARWHNELDLRSIKSTMKMDVLRCKTPELVRKEIWTHILAYNLVRTIMAQAAYEYDIEPRTISFKGTLQTLESFQPLIAFHAHRGKQHRRKIYQALIDSVVLHVVADRPDRFEPRMRKRSFLRVEWMTKPRWELKCLMRKGVTKI